MCPMPISSNDSWRLDALQKLSVLDTPRVVLRESTLMANIMSMQKRAADAGVALRPHVKTHKSLEIARRQLQAGATGLTASKPGEALVFLQAGLAPVTVAYPLLNKESISSLIEAAKNIDAHTLPLRCIADSIPVAQALADAARDAGVRLPVDIKVDVGLKRCGVLPHSRELVELATFIRSCPSLALHGLLSHAGQAYGAKDTKEAADMAESERTQMLAARELITEGDDDSLRISVGSTPTVLAAANFDGIDELRPGNYVFLDRTPIRLGLALERNVALRVLASVISMNKSFIIIDAGSKTLGMDTAPHGYAAGGQLGYGLARPLNMKSDSGETFSVARLSEEHGFLSRNESMSDLRIGDKVLVLPNHSCVVANLAREYTVLAEDGAIRHWAIEASGKVR